MVTFVGAGSGAADLITVRGQRLLQQADVVIYAGSLVNPQLLKDCPEGCEIYDSARMTLEEVIAVIVDANGKGKSVVRLHTGDPCLYGAIKEQMDKLVELGIEYDYCPGVSSFCGAAAALKTEYTLPGVSQSVIITRMPGKTPGMPLENIESFAKHQTTMVIFLSTGLLKELTQQLLAGGYAGDTPAALVYKATWPEERVFHCTVQTLEETAIKNNITKTALIIVGNFLNHGYDRSKLYDPGFETMYRERK